MKFRKTTVDDAQALLNFYTQNRHHLAPWEPERSEHFYSLDYWQEQVKNRTAEMQEGRAAYCVAVDDAGNVIAVCNLTNIVRGFFQAC